MTIPMIQPMPSNPAWSKEQKLAFLLGLPWTIQVSKDSVGNTLVARVGEIADAIANAPNEHELIREIWDSLSASLMVRLEADDSLPVPKGTVLPWDVGMPPLQPTRARRYFQASTLIEPTTSATTVAA